MKYNVLGKTGIEVSEICYGSLPIGPLQANYPVDQAGEVIRYCLEQGINFIDTAQRYETYEHIRRALSGYAKPVVIASKSWASTYEDMRQAVEEARQRLGRDVIDIFHLHAARVDGNVFEKRSGALEYLCEAKVKGMIRAVGISTHSVRIVRLAADNPNIDVIHPLVNMLGLGILEGTLEDMLSAVSYAVSREKGIYLMKAMAGGHLVDRYQQALDFCRQIPGVNAIAIGMLSREEADANIAHVEGRSVAESVKQHIGKKSKKLFVMDQCKACGACVQRCPNGAIQVVGDRAKVDPERCLLCGYCVPYCPQFSLRLINA